MAFPPEDLLHDPRLARHLGVKLLAFALWRPVAPDDPEPRNWQSIEALAKACGLSRSAAYVARTMLVDLGWVSLVRSRDLETGRTDRAVALHDRAIAAKSGDQDEKVPPQDVRSPGQKSPVTRTQKSGDQDEKVPVTGHIGDKGIRGEGGDPGGPAPPAQLSEARTRRDELLARAAEIEARAAHDAEVCRRWPVRPMDPGVNATPEQDQIRDRFRAACERWPKTSPERTRVAACRLSTPLPHVLEAACDELGGLDGVLDVLDWAWGEVAHGRLRAIGKADAAEALRSAFRGEGAYWRGILAAYGRRPTERAPAGEWEWSTPVIADDEIVDPDTMDAMLAEALGR